MSPAVSPSPEPNVLAPSRLPRLRRATPPPNATIETPQLSVVIVNFRQWRNTARLTRQLHDAECARRGASEIIVIDNLSRPHPLRGKVRRSPGVSVRCFQRNRGFARAVNEGCRLSRGQWFLLLNPDVSVAPGFLDGVLDLANRLPAHDPKAGVVGFRLLNRDGTPQGSVGPDPTLVRTLAGLFLPRPLRKCRPVTGTEARRVEWATGCCLLVRRDCLRDVGGFDEDYFLYYEDADFCRRARTRGWTVWHEPALEAVHQWPLHDRRVAPPLRVMTRHALLTYSAKHWKPWQFRLLAGLVGLEAAARQGWAHWNGEELTAGLFSQLRRIASDLVRGRGVRARHRLHRAAKLLGE